MNLDVVVAIFQRPRMLVRALESLLSVPVPGWRPAGFGYGCYLYQKQQQEPVR